MNQDYPELQQFLAGYFNQDWAEDHKNAIDVVRFFISETPTDAIEEVQAELKKLILAPKTEQELQDFLFKDLGCYYYYKNEWKDGKAWLNHIASFLENHKKQ